MTGIWLWLSVAGMGALHGLNPATGWGLAAAWGVGSGDHTKALWALVPIGLGHALSMGFVLGAVMLGLSLDRMSMQIVASLLLAALLIHCLVGHKSAVSRTVAGRAGLALWSFLMSGAHGAGLMLVPSLMPLCIASAVTPDMTKSAALIPALLGVGIHTAAMLVVTGLVATGACRAWLSRPCGGLPVRSRYRPAPAGPSACWSTRRRNSS